MKQTKNDQIISKLKEELGDEFSVTIQKTCKNNNTELTGICIRKNDEAIAPIIYFNPDDDVDTIAKHTIERYENIKGDLAEMQSRQEVMQAITKDKDAFLSRIIPCCVNKDKNSDLISKCPTEELFGDIILAFKLAWESYAVQVTNELASVIDVTFEEMKEAAINNVKPRIRSIIACVTGIDDADADSFEGDDVPFYVIDRDSGKSSAAYGAGAIVAPQTIELIKNKLKTNEFYLFPSSVDEWLALPTNNNALPEDLSNMVREVNANALEAEQFLSDNVYIYKDDKIEVFA